MPFSPAAGSGNDTAVDDDRLPTASPAPPIQDLETAVQKYVEVDNYITHYNGLLRDLRVEKRALTTNVCTMLVNSSLQNHAIQISDGSLRFSDKKQREGLTLRSVQRGLASFFDNDEVKINACMACIDQHREVRKVQTLVRKFNPTTE